jgi:hypothetical protein
MAVLPDIRVVDPPPSGARSIWLRHNLAIFKTRLKALKNKKLEGEACRTALCS